MMMKRVFIFSILTIGLLSMAHKFYVSNTTIYLNSATQHFEITMKIFTDDLGDAIRDDGEPIRLGSKRERSDVPQLVEQYLRENFSILQNGEVSDWEFIGDEVDYDLTFCYIEVPKRSDLKFIEIKNTVLMELFDDQINLIDIRTEGWSKKTSLSKEHPTVILNVNE